MSGFPQYPQQGQIYPQIYNPPNAPPQPGQPAPNYPVPGQNPQYPYQQQPGFAYPYQPQPAPIGQPGAPPAAMSYPGITPTPVAPSGPAYGYPGYPTVTPQPTFGSAVEWIPSSSRDAYILSDKAVVAGFEAHDRSPLWVIRSKFEGDLIPGKLAIKHQTAYIPWEGRENPVHSFEVCCARPDKIRWVESRDGLIPQNAVLAGNTAGGEPLYVGRAREQGSLTPGKVHPSHKVAYISFAGKEIAHQTYELLCTV